MKPVAPERVARYVNIFRWYAQLCHEERKGGRQWSCVAVKQQIFQRGQWLLAAFVRRDRGTKI